jgi:hypothetical protein
LITILALEMTAERAVGKRVTDVGVVVSVGLILVWASSPERVVLVFGGVNGSGSVDQGSWGDGDCGEEKGDGKRGEGDGGIVRIVGGEMNRGGSRSSLLSLSSYNWQRRFRIFLWAVALSGSRLEKEAVATRGGAGVYWPVALFARWSSGWMTFHKVADDFADAGYLQPMEQGTGREGSLPCIQQHS